MSRKTRLLRLAVSGSAALALNVACGESDADPGPGGDDSLGNAGSGATGATGGGGGAAGGAGGSSAGGTASGGTPSVIPPNCNDDHLDSDEVCDGSDLDGASCVSLNLPDGVLTCSDRCQFDTAGCAVCGDGICSDAETPVSCVADCGVVDIAAGAQHTCAALRDGSVWCWGARQGHRMGGAGDTAIPIRVPKLDDVVEVATGTSHTCVRQSDGTVLCWGANPYGQVGTERAHEVFPPVEVTSGERLLAGGDHTCVLLESGTLTCWGMLYDEPQTPRRQEIEKVSLAALGGNHTCLLAEERLSCFGRNEEGQLGLGDRRWRPAPAGVDVADVSAVAAGAHHSCALLQSEGEAVVACWGANGWGQLGIRAGMDELDPAKGAELKAIAIDVGAHYSCAVGATTGVACWGHNARGQLGDGTNQSRHVPATAEGTAGAMLLSAGAEHACAVLDDETLRCWGDNRHGQLGTGQSDDLEVRPIEPLHFGSGEGGQP